MLLVFPIAPELRKSDDSQCRRCGAVSITAVFKIALYGLIICAVIAGGVFIQLNSQPAPAPPDKLILTPAPGARGHGGPPKATDPNDKKENEVGSKK
jgi:hypothetical protein